VLDDNIVDHFEDYDPTDILANTVAQLQLGDLTLSRSMEMPSNSLVEAKSLVANLGLYCNTTVVAPPAPPAPSTLEQIETTVCETYGGFCDDI
jgi:hypothetical protein